MPERLYDVVYSRLVFNPKKRIKVRIPQRLTESELKDLFEDKSERKYIIHSAELVTNSEAMSLMESTKEVVDEFMSDLNGWAVLKEEGGVYKIYHNEDSIRESLTSLIKSLVHYLSLGE